MHSILLILIDLLFIFWKVSNLLNKRKKIKGWSHFARFLTWAWGCYIQLKIWGNFHCNVWFFNFSLNLIFNWWTELFFHKLKIPKDSIQNQHGSIKVLTIKTYYLKLRFRMNWSNFRLESWVWHMIKL